MGHPAAALESPAVLIVVGARNSAVGRALAHVLTTLGIPTEVGCSERDECGRALRGFSVGWPLVEWQSPVAAVIALGNMEDQPLTLARLSLLRDCRGIRAGWLQPEPETAAIWDSIAEHRVLASRGRQGAELAPLIELLSRLGSGPPPRPLGTVDANGRSQLYRAALRSIAHDAKNGDFFDQVRYDRHGTVFRALFRAVGADCAGLGLVEEQDACRDTLQLFEAGGLGNRFATRSLLDRWDRIHRRSFVPIRMLRRLQTEAITTCTPSNPS